MTREEFARADQGFRGLIRAVYLWMEVSVVVTAVFNLTVASAFGSVAQFLISGSLLGKAFLAVALLCVMTLSLWIWWKSSKIRDCMDCSLSRSVDCACPNKNRFDWSKCSFVERRLAFAYLVRLVAGRRESGINLKGQRTVAVELLGEFPDRRKAYRVLTLLFHPESSVDGEVNVAIANAMVNLSEDAWMPLCAGLSSPDPGVIEGCARVLDGFPSQVVVEELLRCFLLNTGRHWVQKAIIETLAALCEKKPANVQPALIVFEWLLICSEFDGEVVEKTVYATGKLDGPNGTKILRKATEAHKDRKDLSATIARVLAKINRPYENGGLA